MTYGVNSAGHGGSDPGAVGNGYKEKDLSIELTNGVNSFIKNNYEDPRMKLIQEKDNMGNFRPLSAYWGIYKSGVALSWHFNSSKDKSAHGTEVLQGKYGTSNIKPINDVLAKYFKNRGIKQPDVNNFYMLREMGFDGIIEVCFISNASDMKIYQANKKQIWAELGTAIAKLLGLKKKNTGGNSVSKQTWSLEKFTSKNGNTIHYTPYKIDKEYRFKVIGANTPELAKKYKVPLMRYMKSTYMFQALVNTNCYSDKNCTKKSGKFIKGEWFYGDYAGTIKRG